MLDLFLLLVRPVFVVVGGRSEVGGAHERSSVGNLFSSSDLESVRPPEVDSEEGAEGKWKSRRREPRMLILEIKNGNSHVARSWEVNPHRNLGRASIGDGSLDGREDWEGTESRDASGSIRAPRSFSSFFLNYLLAPPTTGKPR